MSSAQAKSDIALNTKQQNIVAIASLTAKGDLVELKSALAKGLDTGLTTNEIREMLVHLYAYCGFPRSIGGLQTLVTVLAERKAKGIKDNGGKAASPIISSRTKYERGKDVLEQLTQTKQGDAKPAYQQLSPEIDVFLKEHLLADIFERDVLTFQERELTTVAALITLGNVVPMLRSHMSISIIQGISTLQLKEAIRIIKPNVKRKNIKSAQKILNEIISKQ